MKKQKVSGMIKILLAAAGALMLLTACTGESGHGCDDDCHGKKKFQSVDAKDAVLLQKGDDKESCGVCGMNLPTYYKTNHAITFKDGMTMQFCSIRCLADTIENELSPEKKESLEKIQVVDTNSLAWIDAQSAYYVVGSNKPGTMTMVSKYAFKDQGEAKHFAEEFGGEVVDYTAAYAKAKAGLDAHK